LVNSVTLVNPVISQLPRKRLVQQSPTLRSYLRRHRRAPGPDVHAAVPGRVGKVLLPVNKVNQVPSIQRVGLAEVSSRVELVVPHLARMKGIGSLERYQEKVSCFSVFQMVLFMPVISSAREAGFVDASKRVRCEEM
jgi:hypothetical protein